MSGNGGRGAVVEDDVDAGRGERHESFVRLEREIGLLALRADTGPLRAGDLVARLGLDQSTVSRQVSALVALDMVDREPDPADGRAQVLHPSAEGAARLAGIREVRRARWEADLSGWPADDPVRLAGRRRRHARRAAGPAGPDRRGPRGPVRRRHLNGTSDGGGARTTRPGRRRRPWVRTPARRPG